MLFNKPALGEVASKLLETLSREKILTLRDLEDRVGAKFEIESNPDDVVLLETDDSMRAKNVLVVDYVRKGSGVPIELRFNLGLRYSQSIVKCEACLEGYNPFAVDQFANVVQIKRAELKEDDIGGEELRKLILLTG